MNFEGLTFKEGVCLYNCVCNGDWNRFCLLEKVIPAIEAKLLQLENDGSCDYHDMSYAVTFALSQQRETLAQHLTHDCSSGLLFDIAKCMMSYNKDISWVLEKGLDEEHWLSLVKYTCLYTQKKDIVQSLFDFAPITFSKKTCIKLDYILHQVDAKNKHKAISDILCEYL